MNSLTSSTDNIVNTDITSTASSKKSSILSVFALKAISLILIGVGIIITIYVKRRDEDNYDFNYLLGLVGLCLYFIAHNASTTEFNRKQNKIAKIILITLSTIFIAYGAHIFVMTIGYKSEYTSLTFLPFPFGLLALVGSTGYLKKHEDKIIKGLYLIVGIFSISMLIILAANGHSYFLEYTINKFFFILFIAVSSLFLINIISLLKEVRKFAMKDVSIIVASDTQVNTQGKTYTNYQANIQVNPIVSNYDPIFVPP